MQSVKKISKYFTNISHKITKKICGSRIVFYYTDGNPVKNYIIDIEKDDSYIINIREKEISRSWIPEYIL